VASANRARSADRIDLPVAIRGASLGFSVLLIGILLSTVLRTTMPAAGLAGTIAAYVLAFFLAGRKTGTATVPALHGAFAATVAYALILPLILRDPAGRNIAQIALTLALAVGTGALTGWISSTRRH
jgi:Na+/H+ antiporter NhaA